MIEWNNLVTILGNVSLDVGWGGVGVGGGLGAGRGRGGLLVNIFVWRLHKLTSMYASLISNGIKVSMAMWHMKAPLTIKIFLCFIKNWIIFNQGQPNKEKPER